MNKTLLIVGGVAALGVVGYFLLKKSPASETTTTSDSGEQKSSDTLGSAEASPRALGVGLARKGGTKTDISGKSVVNTNSQDDLFKRFGITQSDYRKMEFKKKQIKQSLVGADEQTKKKELRKQLRDFAMQNNIPYQAYKNAFIGQSTAVASVSPNVDAETESFSFTLNF